MSKAWDDHSILYKDTEEEAAIRAEQETQASNRKEVYGAHCSLHGKARGSFKTNTKIKVGRVKKTKIDTNSKAWKDYLEKKISFSEMKKALGV